jgi:hypothetical protein
MKPKGGFLRKAARLEKKRLKNEKIEKSFDDEVLEIVNKSKDSINDYSVVIAAFTIHHVMEEMQAVLRGNGNIEAYIKNKKSRVDSYLKGVTEAMKRDI